MKDRLTELLNKIQDEGRLYDKTHAFAYRVDNSQIAAFLISQGVIVPEAREEIDK